MKLGVRVALSILVCVGIVALFAVLLDNKQIDVLHPTGETAIAQHKVLIFTVFLSSVVVIPVFTLLIYFSIKYRAGNSKATYRPDWGENRVLESLWWGIPIVIIGILGVLTYHTSHSLDPYTQIASSTKAIEVQVVALRWKWLFIYPEQKIASLNYITVPVGQPIHFSLSADAPMSAFWIPSLGSQVYAMNGMESQLNLMATKVGTYTGYTTNINGEGYAKMTFKTKVVPGNDFKTWIEQSQAATNSLDEQTYSQIALPKSEPGERTYRLADTDLFETIVHKNMSHRDASKPAPAGETHATAEHEGHQQ